MPSHRVHEAAGKVICGFSSRDIDELIDRGRGHDAGRKNCRKLLVQATEVYNKYGENGLCYYILHHYLDKIASIIKGRFGRILTQYLRLPVEERFRYYPQEVKKGLLDEVSTLSYLADESSTNLYLEVSRVLQETLGLSAERYIKYREYVNKGYAKKTAKKKAEARLEIASSCADVYIYRGIKKLIDISVLAKQILHVRTALLTNTEKIVCIMLTIDNEYWLEWFGRDYYNKIASAFSCLNQ
jgi:hypothetical protein